MTGPDDANASADASGRSFGHSSVAASLRHLSRNSTRKANKKEVKGKGLMQRFWVNVVPYLFVDAAALLVLTQPLEVIIPVLPASPSTHDWGRDMKGMGIELVHHTCVMNRRHPGSRAVGTECGVVHARASKTGINVCKV